MDLRWFHKRLADAATELIPRGCGIVCAVSGGADSMALLTGLVFVNESRRRGWRIHVAHLDHGLREDSEDDRRFVEAQAARLSLPLVWRREDVRERSEADGVGIEEAGREARYEFLRETAEDVAAQVVALGHHADDQAETILHHIVRGTGLRGLAGMPASRPIRPRSAIRLVRPLLGIRRCDIEAYLQERGIPYRHDHTNHDPGAATRNLIRHELLPLLETRLNPRATEALIRLSEQARMADDALRFAAREALEQIISREGDDKFEINALAFALMPGGLRSEIVVAGLEKLGVTRKAVGFRRIKAAVESGQGDGRLRRIELGSGATVERRGSRIIFRSGAAQGERPTGRRGQAVEPCR